jgi:hypothetical protein
VSRHRSPGRGLRGEVRLERVDDLLDVRPERVEGGLRTAGVAVLPDLPDAVLRGTGGDDVRDDLVRDQSACPLDVLGVGGPAAEFGLDLFTDLRVDATVLPDVGLLPDVLRDEPPGVFDGDVPVLVQRDRDQLRPIDVVDVPALFLDPDRQCVHGPFVV